MSLSSRLYIRSPLSSYCLLINIIEMQHLCRQACTYYHSLHSAEALLRMRHPVCLVLSMPVVPPNLLSLRSESEFALFHKCPWKRRYVVFTPSGASPLVDVYFPWPHFRQLIRASFRNTARGALLTTHSMAEAEAVCDRVAIMVSGSLRWVGPRVRSE